MAQMEEEASKLNQYTEQQTTPVVTPAAPAFHTLDEKKEIDGRSIYVGNVSGEKVNLVTLAYRTADILCGQLCSILKENADFQYPFFNRVHEFFLCALHVYLGI